MLEVTVANGRRLVICVPELPKHWIMVKGIDYENDVVVVQNGKEEVSLQTRDQSITVPGLNQGTVLFYKIKNKGSGVSFTFNVPMAVKVYREEVALAQRLKKKCFDVWKTGKNMDIAEVLSSWGVANHVIGDAITEVKIMRSKSDKNFNRAPRKKQLKDWQKPPKRWQSIMT